MRTLIVRVNKGEVSCGIGNYTLKGTSKNASWVMRIVQFCVVATARKFKVVSLPTSLASELSWGDKIFSAISKGIALFVCMEQDDEDSILEEMAEKVTNIRIFEDSNNKLNYSIKEKKYQILCIPNFTLCANTKKGRRPSFEGAVLKEKAGLLFANFITLLRARGIEVKTGAFGEHMDIKLDFDGPVNIIIDIPDKSEKNSVNIGKPR
ncbi:MAG: D-aminoacyl-tRNA deacylase [Candidatus Omnitrophota bacterium]|nr:D-aminoacyl-tRNA deacylase [Candidatus Omnitrophota bacterium]